MNPQFSVLLVEDSEEDGFLFRRALAKLDRTVALHWVRDAPEAQRFLLGEGEYANRVQHPLPGVIFCDLSLPGRSGLEFLQWLRAQPALKTIPCLIYSGSANPADVQTAYECGVTSFVVKPTDFREWNSRIEVILKFWKDIAQRPSLD